MTKRQKRCTAVLGAKQIDSCTASPHIADLGLRHNAILLSEGASTRQMVCTRDFLNTNWDRLTQIPT
uniref:Transposase n=1 Tax=Ascaris lumbricoides TaxID=6252 RepID=A0A0M3IAS4_ASCLU